MLSFKQYLLRELFDTPTDESDWTSDGYTGSDGRYHGHYYDKTVTVDGIKYHISVTLITINHPEYYDHVEDIILNAPDLKADPNFYAKVEDYFDQDGDIWDIEFSSDEENRGHSIGIAGRSKNPAKVFSVIINSLTKLASTNREPLTAIMLSAKEASRQSLYSRLVPRFFAKAGYKSISVINKYDNIRLYFGIKL